jgi:hypothetical protein
MGNLQYFENCWATVVQRTIELSGSHHIVLPLSCLSELHTIRWKYTVAWSAQDFLAEMSQKFAA